DDGAAGVGATDDLDESHRRNRVEEVESDNTVRPVQGGGDGRDRQGGRIGREHSLRTHDRLKLGEHRLLDLEPFNDGFDHQVAASQAFQRLYATQPGQGSVGVVTGDPTTLDCPVQARRDRVHGGV